MAQQINEITKMPSNSEVIKILNQIIKRYNSLGHLYQYKGSVQTYDDLLAIQNPQIGDVYNVIQEDAEEGIAAGSNFAWNGTEWDNLGGSLAGLVQSVNGINPDSLGNVLLPLIKNITTNQGVLTIIRNNNSTEQFNNVKKLYMLTLGENINLNDLTESGIYICVNNTYAVNYENCPIQKAFLLEVQATVAGNFIFQFLTQYNDGSTEAGNQYTRTCYNNNWSVWRMAGSGSNLTTYTSLDQIGITPGQETFESIHNALPLNSELVYYITPNNFNNSIYPNENYGYMRCSKISDSSSTSFMFITQNNDVLNIYTRYFNSTYSLDERKWDKLIGSEEKATQVEAEAGINDNKFMTPLKVKQAIIAQVQGISIGDVVYRPFLMAGYVKANGATVNRSDYPNLVTFANTNNLWTSNPASEPWKYGVGDGSSTMVLPDYRNRFIEGSDTPGIINAGLPNITGGFDSGEFGGSKGAFAHTSYWTEYAGHSDGYHYNSRYTFDASRSSSIYGNSNIVQPASITLIPQIKY